MLDLYQVDLLRERRAQLGLPEPKPVNAQYQLRKGMAIGAGMVAVVVALLAFSGLRLWALTRSADALEPKSRQYQALEQVLQGLKSRQKELEDSRDGLVDQILSLPSSSALLQAIALLTPSGVQITQLSEKDGELVIKGQTVDPQAFARVDALVLGLSKSPLFDPKSVVLLKAQRGQGQPQAAAAPAQPAQAPAAAQPSTPSSSAQPSRAPTVVAGVSTGTVDFELNVKFSETPAKELVGTFLGLGARGKALRIQQLQQEGLMP